MRESSRVLFSIVRLTQRVERCCWCNSVVMAGAEGGSRSEYDDDGSADDGDDISDQPTSKLLGNSPQQRW